MNHKSLNEEHDDCTNAIQNEEIKTERAAKNEKNYEILHLNEKPAKTAGNSGQISSISLKMISDCVNLVVDQSHIQLSSVIHISKIDNQLNIEHKMMESSSSNVRESSSESTEENNINSNSCFYANNSARSLPKDQQHLNVNVHQATCSKQPSVANASLNTNPGTSSGNSNLISSTGNNHTELTRNRPPPYTKNAQQKRLSARQLLNELYSGSSSSLRFDGITHPPPVCPRIFHHGILSAPPLHGAPPTYSAVMRNAPIPHHTTNNSGLFNSLFRRPDVYVQPSVQFVAPPRPPPTYAEVQGVSVAHRAPIDLAGIDHDIQWGPTPVSVSCPNCGNVVLTVVRLHRSNLTHFSALTLCLCGCWPCCLLPYCMKTCKTTYHECPICFTVIGMFTPW